MSNEAITPQNAPVKSLKEAWSSNLVESSSSLEKTFNDQYNNAIGDERALHSSDDVSTTLNSTLSERDLPSDVVFASQENMMQLAPENVKSSRPLKKGGQEVTEVPIFLKACNARGVSVGSRTDVEAQFILSSITTKDVIEVEHSEDIGLLAPHAKFQEKHFIVQPTGQIQEPLCGDQSDQPEGVASQTENVSKKKGHPKGKKCSGGRPQAVSLGMALESEGLEHDSTINEVTDSMTSYVAEESQPLLPKQIDLQEVGVANQTENLLKRKRGRPKGSGGKQKRGRPEAVSSGMTFEVQDEQHTLYLSFEKSESLVDNKDKDPELEAGSKEMMFIQTECTQLLSPAEEETPTSFPCLENSDAPMSENNGDQQLMPNVVINAVDASTHSFKHIESSTVAGNSLSLVEFVDDHYDNARGYESDTHISVEGTTATHLSPSRHIEACRSLPFIKSSLLWESVESMEVFKILPQQPHFCPLEQYNEVAREGMAIGKMLIFANLLEKTGRVKLDEPRSTLEDKLEALMDIEECGFTVQPIRTRLEELLSIKDSINELDDKSKAIEREVSDEKLKYDEVEDSLEQLNMELQVLVMDKEMKDHNVAELQRTIDEIQENIEDVRSEFNRLVASPWWTSIGDELSQNI
ncbi:hypothetical protein IFM89_035317 [Coptis chinensis]|uniref:Uncharacterized protein n=1 Tax=Coptis chinensis TaxID=261450 RepID=A0A835MB57_9MAGN|nr:hypothetical protein IFM89_035317 [Coptis chinensis]